MIGLNKVALMAINYEIKGDGEQLHQY